MFPYQTYVRVRRTWVYVLNAGHFMSVSVCSDMHFHTFELLNVFQFV